MFVRTVFKPRLVSRRSWRSDMGGLLNLVPKVGDVGASSLIVSLTSVSMSRPPFLSFKTRRTWAALAASGRPTLRVGLASAMCLFQSRTRALNRETKALCLSMIWGVFVPERFPGPAIVGGQLHIERLAPAFGDGAGFSMCSRKRSCVSRSSSTSSFSSAIRSSRRLSASRNSLDALVLVVRH